LPATLTTIAFDDSSLHPERSCGQKDGAAQQRCVDLLNCTYGTSGWIGESVKLEISAPKSPWPFVGFVGHEPARRHRRVAQIGKELLQF
jgi:hypothetical protein